MDVIAKLWRKYVGGGNINKTLEDIHARYGKMEYLLPAIYVLYCLIIMQLVVKSFEATEGFKRSLITLVKVFLVHIGLTAVVFVVISQLSDSVPAKLLQHFSGEQLPSGFIVFIIPISCMFLAFLLGGLRKLFSKE